MGDKITIEIQELQAKIEKEKENELTCLLMSLSESKDDKDNDAYLETKNKNFDMAILTWLCLKIELECQALRNGNREWEDSLRSDISSAFDYVQKCEHKWKLSKSVIADTIDLLLSIGTVKEKELNVYSVRYVPRFIRERKKISGDMYFLFASVTRQLLSIGKETTAYYVIERLCILSRMRNYKERHKQLIVNAFSIIFEGAPSTICRIASVDEKCFVNDDSEYAGDFYWFYACSLWKIENTSEASRYFDICYSVRKKIYGEDHWLTALARRNKAVISYVTEKDILSLNYLRKFIQCIEDGMFCSVESGVIVEAETIWFYLNGQFDEASDLAEYKRLLDIYERICSELSESGNPLISTHLAWNFRGGYHFQCGEYILAEEAFQHALKETADRIDNPVLSADQIKTNLFLISSVQNDAISSAEILSKLLDKETDLSETDFFRVCIIIIENYVQFDMVMNEEEIHTLKEFTQRLCENVIAQNDSAKGCATAMFICAVVVYFLQFRYPIASAEEQKLYLEALRCVERDRLIYKLSKIQECVLILAEALLAWNLNLPETEEYMNKLVSSAESAGVSLVIKASMNQTLANFLGKSGKYHSALYYTEKLMGCLTEMWHSDIKYVNDTRLVNILSPVQFQFNCCYAIVRQCVAVEKAYECVLRFKAISSLAGRERNRIIHTVTMESDLIKKINTLQDRIAALETAELFQECIIEREELKDKLRKYESEFALRFPRSAGFKEISWKLVESAIPDNSAVLEYFFTVNDFGQTQFQTHPDEDVLGVMDLYFIKKQNGRTSLKRYIIDHAITIIERAEQFIAIYQERSTNNGVSENDEALEELRHDLYEALLKPIIDEISDSTTLYFAPDSTLVNLPFELLYEDESLEKLHQIVKIECARDFLFTSSDETAVKGSLIIGNPEYFVKEKEITMEGRSNGRTRNIDLDLAKIEQLPFAEIEVHRVADYLSAFPWVGKVATKEKLLSAEGYRNLHIATHGFFDLNGETNVIYSSCLVFAGVKNWMQNISSSIECGNGIVTADEISRLNLKSTKLVVLSSCLNGRNDMIISKGFQGMVGAFAAAGVEYVIAHLWNTPETIGTVIFMDTFYYCYMEEKLDPPLALAKAKEYLKTLTINRMREQGWFDYVRNSNFDFAAKRSVEMLEKCDGRQRPYKDEIFWGGFCCYRCN